MSRVKQLGRKGEVENSFSSLFYYIQTLKTLDIATTLERAIYFTKEVIQIKSSKNSLTDKPEMIFNLDTLKSSQIVT